MTEGTTSAAAEGGDTLTRLEQEGEIAADYLEGLLDIADLDGDIDMDVEADRAAVSIISDSGGRDLQKLVGRDGEVLEALQELTRLAVHRETGDRSRLMLDIAGYRAKKRDELSELGAKAAAEVKSSGEPVKLKPMTPFERKVVHDAVKAARAAQRVRGRGAAALRRRASRLTRYVRSPAPSVRRRGRTLSACIVLASAPSALVRYGRTVPVTEAAELPPAPEQAREVFGDRFADAVRYAELLAEAGVQRGLIGPREVPRLWERHLLNCAVLSEVVPEGVTVCDVGSGAGLPGIPLALVREDLKITLLEPLLRRTNFLSRGRGAAGPRPCDGRPRPGRGGPGKLQPVHVVTARAVAPLDRLAAWGIPLLRPYGEMLALKGDTAEEELKSAAAALSKLGVVETSVLHVGEGVVDPLSTVVRVEVGESPGGVRFAAKRAKAARAGRDARRRRWR